MERHDSWDAGDVDRVLLSFTDGTDGFYDEPPELRAELRVAIRIGGEFVQFLRRFPEKPDQEECDYAADTVRSGLDQLYRLRYLQRMVTDVEWSDRDEPTLSYGEVRRRAGALFDRMIDAGVHPAERLARLIAIGRLQLAFLVMAFEQPTGSAAPGA